MNRYSCPTCGLEIDGKHLPFPELETRAHQRECFVCQACGKRIDSAIKFHEDQPYHAFCMDLDLDPRCPGCGGPIPGDGRRALGGTWHPEHFVCTNCRDPLPAEHDRQVDGKPYCEPCYQSLFLLHCDICRRPLSGDFIKNPWGDQYCSTHVYELRECSCCRRPICASITGGGANTPDGRPLCNLCRKTSVNRLSQAWPAFNKVRQYLSRQGLDLGHTSLSLELVERGNLSALPSQAKPDHAFHGLAARLLVPVTARTESGPEEKIRILNGLPWELFSAVCACELGHAWLHIKKNSMLAAAAEQDFCKSLGRRWLESLGTLSAGIWIKILGESQANLYSLGPRASLPARKSDSYFL